MTYNLVWAVLSDVILTQFNARSSRRWQRQLWILSLNYLHGDRALKAQLTLAKWRSLSIKQNRISKQVVGISHPTLKWVRIMAANILSLSLRIAIGFFVASLCLFTHVYSDTNTDSWRQLLCFLSKITCSRNNIFGRWNGYLTWSQNVHCLQQMHEERLKFLNWSFSFKFHLISQIYVDLSLSVQ